VFFAPAERPRIAGVVFAEHARSGGNAAPIARHALETFFAKQEGRALPPAPEPPASASPPTTADDVVAEHATTAVGSAQ
jgi:hypothetical protein